MLGDETFGYISDSSGNLTRGLLEGDDNKKTDPGWIPVNPCSRDQQQDALLNASLKHPQAVIIDPKKPAHYKMFSGPKGEYLFSDCCIPVQVAINNPKPGLELSVTLKYKDLTHQNEAVQACHEHFNKTPAELKGMDLRTPNKAAFVLMAGCSRNVKYELEGLHPTACVTLNTDAEKDIVNLVFPCYSSCKPHKNCGSLMLLHLTICDINTRGIVSSSKLTVRVARNVLGRASKKYEKDMLGKTTSRRPAKRPMPGQGGEGLKNTAEVLDVVDKRLKREHGDEKKDDAPDVVSVVNSERNQDCAKQDDVPGVVKIVTDHTEVNNDGEGCDDSDVAEMADYIFSCDRLAKEAFERMMAYDQAEASSSTLASDDNFNINGMGSASNQLPLLEARSSTNNSTVNIGATLGITQDSMAYTNNLPIQMKYRQTTMVPIANNSTVTVVNQNKMPPEECSSTSSTFLDNSNNPPVSLQEYHAVSDAVVLVVTGLKNPESDCHQIQQFVESLGASCSQGSVVHTTLD